MTKSDVQSDLITMSEAYSSRVLKDLSVLIRNDLRNLNNDELAVFYNSTNKLTQDDLSNRYESVKLARTDGGLTPILSTTFLDQITGSNNKLIFKYVMESLGLEEEYVEDLVEETYTSAFPNDPDRQSFLFAQEQLGRQMSNPSVLDRINSDSVLSEQVFTGPKTKHLKEDASYAVADSDPKVVERLERMFEYVRSYFR